MIINKRTSNSCPFKLFKIYILWYNIVKYNSISKERMVEMCKVVNQIGEFRILQVRNGYVVKNLKGKYEHHGHFQKLSTCYQIIKIVRRKQVPIKDYFIESAIRLTLDDKYRESLLLKQEKRRNKQLYFNSQKGVRTA